MKLKGEKIYEVTRMDNDILSVVFKGTGKFQNLKDFNILKSVNLDVAKSSNEITYTSLLKDDEQIRKILAKTAIDQGTIDFFEAEGINVYFKDKQIVFYYMPLDDSAVHFIEISILIDEIEKLLNENFGEKPASWKIVSKHKNKLSS